MSFKWIKNNLANILSIVSLFWGFSSILASIQTINELYAHVINGNDNLATPEVYLGFAGLCIIIATIFDFLDGTVARRFNLETKLGKELDSLSDLVSFGIAPGVLFYTITLIAGGHVPGTGIYYVTKGFPDTILPHLFLLKILAFVFPTCAVIRLASFNLKKKTNYFEGVPSTYAGGFTALILTFNFYLTPINGIYKTFFGNDFPATFPYLTDPLRDFFSNYLFIVFSYLVLSFLMISNLKFYKIHGFLKLFKSKISVSLGIFFLLFMVLIFKYMAFVICILYIVFCLLYNIYLKYKNKI